MRLINNDREVSVLELVFRDNGFQRIGKSLDGNNDDGRVVQQGFGKLFALGF